MNGGGGGGGVLRRIGFSCASFREGTIGGRFAGFFLFFFVGQSVGGRYGRWTGVSSLYGFICLFGAFLIFFWGCEGGLRRGYSAFFSSRSFGIFFMGLSTEGVLGGVLFYFLGCIFFFLTEC